MLTFLFINVGLILGWGIGFNLQKKNKKIHYFFPQARHPKLKVSKHQSKRREMFLI